MLRSGRRCKAPMHLFSSTLLREKFDIEEAPPDKETLTKKESRSGTAAASKKQAPDLNQLADDRKKEGLTVVSNRMALFLRDCQGAPGLDIIIRTHTMHSCVRMAAEIAKIYYSEKKKPKPEIYDWPAIWAKVMHEEQQELDPDFWGAVFIEGRRVFSTPEYHVFFDVIEKFSYRHKTDYEASIAEAEKAFDKAGKKVLIDYDSQIAAIFDIDDKRTKCGLILRSPQKTTTCNFIVTHYAVALHHIMPAFLLTSLYLEGIHHGFVIGYHESLIGTRRAENISLSEAIILQSRKHIYDIQETIRKVEKKVNVAYRPERPSFRKIIKETIAYNTEQTKTG